MSRSTGTVTLTFKPKPTARKFLKALAPRAQEVLERRYGIGKDTNTVTLEAIGKTYGITRERVRQIEKYALANIRKSELFEEEQQVFAELKALIDQLGSIIAEEELLERIVRDTPNRNALHFLLVLGEPFTYQKETPEFHSRWCTDDELAKSVEKSITEIYKGLKKDALIPEDEIVGILLTNVASDSHGPEIAGRWLSLSKKIGCNPLGEWGLKSSPNVQAKGMRDFAYLAIKQHGSPMHFREVAKAIQELFNKKAHEATCHNELIKDARFVLVGRGLYALSEWGYSKGVVKEVIKDILEKNGPLTRPEIISLVRKERYVKDNTIMVNLQDTKTFKRNSDDTYSLR